MNANYFPITSALSRDSELIIDALNTRSQEIKTASQNQLRRISILALQLIGMAAAVLTLASLPVAVIMFTATIFPVKVAAISFSLSLIALGLSVLLSPTGPGETIIKNLWKSLFFALRQGDGALILRISQELEVQKQHRRDSFKSCLGPLPPETAIPFFNKSRLVGYLLIALQHQRKGDRDQAITNAQNALSYFDQSGFPEDVKRFIKICLDNPHSMQQLLKLHHHSQYPIHALDTILVTRLQIK